MGENGKIRKVFKEKVQVKLNLGKDKGIFSEEIRTEGNSVLRTMFFMVRMWEGSVLRYFL